MNATDEQLRWKAREEVEVAGVDPDNDTAWDDAYDAALIRLVRDSGHKLSAPIPTPTLDDWRESAIAAMDNYARARAAAQSPQVEYHGDIPEVMERIKTLQRIADRLTAGSLTGDEFSDGCLSVAIGMRPLLASIGVEWVDGK
ncbi:MAG: hypothetical protein WC683_10000 [bacterium]